MSLINAFLTGPWDADMDGGAKPLPWETAICPNCGADGIVRQAQDGPVRYPETVEAPCFCQVCGWEGEAGETLQCD